MTTLAPLDFCFLIIIIIILTVTLPICIQERLSMSIQHEYIILACTVLQWIIILSIYCNSFHFQQGSFILIGSICAWKPSKCIFFWQVRDSFVSTRFLSTSKIMVRRINSEKDIYIQIWSFLWRVRCITSSLCLLSCMGFDISIEQVLKLFICTK